MLKPETHKLLILYTRARTSAVHNGVGCILSTVLSALREWQVLSVQREAGGRADAPAVCSGIVVELAGQWGRSLVFDSHDLLRVVWGVPQARTYLHLPVATRAMSEPG